MDLGDYLRSARRKAGFRTQRELANVTIVSAATISRIENGISDPTVETIEALAAPLNLTFNELMDANRKLGVFKGASERKVKRVDVKLSQDQFKELKKQILDELRREEPPRKSPYPLTSELNIMVSKHLGGDSQITQALSTITRRSFNVRHQTYFSGKMLDDAIEMNRELVEVIKRYWKDGDEK